MDVKSNELPCVISTGKCESLPDDELQLVFDYLAAKDRITAALVCKQWLRVANQKKYLRDIKFKVTKRHFEVPTSRVFCCFVIDYCELDENDQKILEGLGSQMVHLAFRCTNFECPIKLDSFPNLESLNFCACENVSFMFDKRFKFHKLTTLVLYRNLLSDEQFKIICDLSPNLNKLILVVRDIRVDNKFKYNVSPDALLDCLKLKAAKLTSLFLDFKRIDSSMIEAVARVPHLCLKKLFLNCRRVNFEDILKEVSIFQPNLSYLYVNSFGITGDHVITLCTRLPQLETLHIDHSTNLSNDAVRHIFQLRHLKRLGLVEATVSTDIDQILKSISPNLNLITLDLSGMMELQDEDVLALCDCFPNLQDLLLELCKQLTDISAVRVFQLPHLRRLSLRRCKKITSEGFMQAFEHCCCHLQELDVQYCNITSDFILMALDRFHNLKALGINGFRLSPLIEVRMIKSKVKKHLNNRRMFERFFWH